LIAFVTNTVYGSLQVIRSVSSRHEPATEYKLGLF